jgi:hypothetical protein
MRVPRWLVSRRSRDLALYGPDGIFSVASMAQVLHLRDKAGATLVSQVARTTNITVSRQLDRWGLCGRAGHGWQTADWF